MLSLSEIDQIVSLPQDFMLVARSSLLLRGLGGKLRVPISCAESWKQEAVARLCQEQ